MASRNDKTWNENFACYMDYVNTYHRLPPPRAMHNGVAVGGWLRNQINFYKRNELPKEREEQLNAFTRAWISGGKERRKKINIYYLFRSGRVGFHQIIHP